MKRCDLLVDVGRRRFLSGAGVAAAGAAATAVMPAGEAKAAVPTAAGNLSLDEARQRQGPQGQRALPGRLSGQRRARRPSQDGQARAGRRGA